MLAARTQDEFIAGIKFDGGEVTRTPEGTVELELDNDDGVIVMTPQTANNLKVALQFFFLEVDGYGEEES